MLIKIVTLVILTILLLASHTLGQNNLSSFKWACRNSGKCVPIRNNTIVRPPFTNKLYYSYGEPSATPNVDSLSQKNTHQYASQNICRLVCGKYGSLFPIPTIKTELGDNVIEFNVRLIAFDLDENDHIINGYLTKTIPIFMANVLRECTNSTCDFNSPNHLEIKLTALTNSLKFNWETDEGYSLTTVTQDNKIKVHISSSTVYGVRNGLETLSQLITGKSQQRNGILDTLVTVQSVRILDNPVYPHRGLLVDTARNFVPLDILKRIVDGMSASKLNIFHWHVTDSQSFPLELWTVPQMTKFGAYSSQETYYKEEVREFYEYARIRGVRIIIELDMPAHAGNGWQWGPGAGLGNLAVCVNQQPWRQFCIQPPCGQLNPTNVNLYRVLRDIFQEIMEFVPPEEAFHMGGDEVFLNCWNSTQEIVDLLQRKGQGRKTEDFLQLWSEFQATALGIWDEASGTTSCSRGECKSPTPIILWSSHLTTADVIENYLPSARYIIQTWVESSNPLPEALLSLGYKLIMSTKNAWYLDHGFWGTTTYYPWRVVYNNRIKREANVLGGEACMWSEYVDGNGMEARIFPRAAALGERLWSDPETLSSFAELRFYRHRQRLIDRGVKNDAVTPGWCVYNDGECV